jgi:hypothetical protein
MATFPSKVNYVTGDVLTATNMNEIGQAINLLDGAQYSAGKNKVINGDFGINQRSFTTSTTSAAYGFDRWAATMVDGTVTYSAQSFTLGAAPVAGYEGTNFARIVTTGQTLATARANFNQNLESVRTLAGQTATVSFWAKAASGTPKMAIELLQNFGTSGSPSTFNPIYAGQVTLSTSWARYSLTIAVTSISGKTLGTDNNDYLAFNLFVSAGSNLNSRTGSLGIQSNTFDIWGVQIEEADTASPFQTATGTKQGELALCQRFYQRFAAVAANYYIGGRGNASSTTSAMMQFSPLTTMRVYPAALDYSNLGLYDEVNAPAVSAATILTIGNQNSLGATYTSSSLTQFRNYTTVSGATTAGYIGFSADL